MNHTALNPTHQRAIERLYKADRNYCAMVDRHAAYLDSLDPDSDKHYAAQVRIECKESETLGNLVERHIDEPELPKRELEAFAKSYIAFHGYTPYLV
jgi:anti-sigma-K factor RskA